MSDPDQIGAALLEIARRAIQRSLGSGERPNPANCLPPGLTGGPLFKTGASFVTLHREQKLRGCMGSLTAEEPLYQNVALNAYRAAMRDPRFSPLAPEEFAGLSIHIAVLGALERIDFQNENDLPGLLKPGRDGVLLRDGNRQATFLPAVWQQLKEPERFLNELKRKARLPLNRPLPGLEVFRYSVRSFPD